MWEGRNFRMSIQEASLRAPLSCPEGASRRSEGKHAVQRLVRGLPRTAAQAVCCMAGCRLIYLHKQCPLGAITAVKNMQKPRSWKELGSLRVHREGWCGWNQVRGGQAGGWGP